MAEEPADFESWYRQAHPRLGTALAVAFGDAGLAQDAADEAFARALQHWDRVAVMQSPTGWVYRVGFNYARRRLRRQSLERRLLLRNHRAEPAQAPAGEMWTVVAALPVRQRQAVALRHVEQLKETEIAAVMGISRGTVSSTLRAAYQTLRLAIADPPEAP